MTLAEKQVELLFGSPLAKDDRLQQQFQLARRVPIFSHKERQFPDFQRLFGVREI